MFGETQPNATVLTSRRRQIFAGVVVITVPGFGIAAVVKLMKSGAVDVPVLFNVNVNVGDNVDEPAT